MKQNTYIEKSWCDIINKEFEKEYMKNLFKNLIQERTENEIYPNNNDVFNAFNYTRINDIKIVILGQDPYHGKGQANGLAFSVSKGIPPPPSLINIFKEINRDLGINNYKNGDLTKWARQGILLLNSTLTVRSNNPGSHQNKGWEQFTDKMISIISKKKDGIIFLLWGKFAQKKKKLIDTTKHHILISSHPSPLSSYRGFIGCGHFSECNEILKNKNKNKINWKL